MTHPCVVTLERQSRPRVLFAGDRLVEVDLPPGTRCIYPKPPIAPVKSVDAAIRYALNHPLGSDPLYAKLRPGMKVTIAVDDISLPLPPMTTPDIRQRITIDDDHVRQFPHRNAADVFVNPHRLGGGQGAAGDGLHRRHAAAHVALQLQQVVAV